jgi:hypothetical protein
MIVEGEIDRFDVIPKNKVRINKNEQYHYALSRMKVKAF